MSNFEKLNGGLNEMSHSAFGALARLVLGMLAFGGAMALCTMAASMGL